ncbi:O-methyltransferase [Seiridium cupressi]
MRVLVISHLETLPLATTGPLAMDGLDLTQLTACVSELAAQASSLAAKCHQVDKDGVHLPQPLAQEILRVKKSIAVTTAKLQRLVQEPTDFLRRLAHQVQLLACIQWLAEFQILAFIPLDRSVPMEDIAELASVPRGHLTRVVRLTATAGFLQEPSTETGRVAHTPLSTHFVTKLSYLDAAMFISDLAAPTALQMTKATKRFGQSRNPTHSAYNMARGTAVPFASVWDDHQFKLRRQWPAYLKHVVNNPAEGGNSELLESLGCLDRLEGATQLIVEIAAESAERAILLARHYPAAQFAVQMTGPGIPGGFRTAGPPDQAQKEVLIVGRITISRRAIGSPQPVGDAALYIFDLSVSSLNMGQPSEHISAELRAHMDILRSNRNSGLVLISFIAPDMSASYLEEESTASLRELTMLQLHNHPLVSFNELSELVNNTNDRMGRLSVVREAFSLTRDAVALEIRYLSYPSN